MPVPTTCTGRPDVVAAARRAWAGLVGDPAGFRDGTTVVVSPGSLLAPDGCVGLVSVDGAVLASAPDERLARVLRTHLAGMPAAQATSPLTWTRALDVSHVLGPARLAYLPWDVDAPAGGVVVVDRSGAEVVALLASVTPDEAEESGLDSLTSPAFVVRDRAGRVLAASGYRRWPGGVAHLCVLAAGTARGRGLGRRVAAAAVDHAVRAGLLPQWRARVEPSRRIARALGFVEVGDQLALGLHPVTGP